MLNDCGDADRTRGDPAAKLLASPRLSASFLQHLRPGPAGSYVHPKSLAACGLVGEHDANLDVAHETSPNYLQWIADLLRPYLGQSVLELGAGIGSITERYALGRHVVATDVSEECVQILQSRFEASSNITVNHQDLRELREGGERFDSIVMINVLEHIEDDTRGLARARELLSPNGTVLVYVPALNGLFGAWDRKVGHFRRYSKWRLRAVAEEAGLDVVELRYVNMLAIPAWFAFSRTDVEKNQRASLTIWDRTGVPVIRAFESRVRVPIGLNVLAVLRSAA